MSENENGVTGLYEMHIPVSDLKRSVALYSQIPGLEIAQEFPDRNMTLFWTGGKTSGMFGLLEIANEAIRARMHFSFAMPLKGVLGCIEMLSKMERRALGYHGEDIEEPVVIGWMPAVSVFMRDPDNHLVEFISILDEDPDPSFGVQPYSAWLESRKIKND